jgi:mRNA interferase MazF
MKRGEVWTVAAGAGYAGKPRPAVIVQENRFDAMDSLTVVAFTTAAVAAPLIRLPVSPSANNGLRSACSLMIDKIHTVPKSKFGQRIGTLDHKDVIRLNRAMLVFLGLAATSGSKRRR